MRSLQTHVFHNRASQRVELPWVRRLRPFLTVLSGAACRTGLGESRCRLDAGGFALTSFMINPRRPRGRPWPTPFEDRESRDNSTNVNPRFRAPGAPPLEADKAAPRPPTKTPLPNLVDRGPFQPGRGAPWW